MALLSEDMKQMVERQRLGFVATTCPDGSPNLSPKGTLRVLDDEHLVFADLRSPGTIRNLQQNSIVEVNVVDPFVRKGYRFKGEARLLERGEEFDALVAFYSGLGLSYAPRKIQTVVIIRVVKGRPLISPAHESGVDEASIRDRWTRYYFDQAMR